MREAQGHTPFPIELFRNERALIGVFGAYLGLCLALLFTFRSASWSATEAALAPGLEAAARAIAAAPTSSGSLPADLEVHEIDPRHPATPFEAEAIRLLPATPGRVLRQLDAHLRTATLSVAVASEGRVLLVSMDVSRELLAVEGRFVRVYLCLAVGGLLVIVLLAGSASLGRGRPSLERCSSAKAALRSAVGLVALSFIAFAVDLRLPSGRSDALIYLLPTLISLRSPRRHDTWITAGLCSVLLAIRVALSSPLTHPWLTLINSTSTVAALWLAVFIGLWQQRSQRAKSDAEAQSESAFTAMSALSSALARAESAECELRKRQAVLDAMASMAQVGAWEADGERRVFEWSEEIYRIHELPLPSEAHPSDPLSLYTPEARETALKALADSFETGSCFDLILPLTRTAGRSRFLRLVGSPVLEEGKIVRFRGAMQDVTATHEIQQRLTRASRASAEGHWEYDFTNNTNWMSASYRELLGGEPRDGVCTESELLDAVHPEDRSRMAKAFGEYVRTRGHYEIELRLRHRDGNYRWFRSRAAAEFDSAGNPLRVGGAIIDIETEKTARLELETLRARHDRALKGTHDGAWDWGLLQDECWMSPQFRMLLGYAPDDMESLPNTSAAFVALMHPDDEARVQEASVRHLEHNEKYDVEFRLRMRDGSYRWFRSRASAEHDSEGRAVTFSGSIQDIQDQKEAEFESAEAKRRLARAIEGSSDALFEAEFETGRPSWYSPRLREMLGYGPDDPFPNSLRELLSPADAQAVLAASVKNLEDDLPCEVVVQVPTRAGDMRWLRLRWRGERIGTGRQRRFSGSIQDITLEREAETAMRAATGAAAAANRAKSEFLANMSHEIRTPLNGVLGMTELLLDGPLEAAQREYADTIRTSGVALLKIINDILDLSKIDAGKLTLEHVPMDARDCVRRVSALLAPQARQRGLRLHSEVDADVPARMLGDPLRLEQILLNLAGNALKFTHQGEVSIHVRVLSRSGRSAVLGFEVRDSGIGMNAATIARLFTPFTQADTTTTRHYGGTGLGLSIVKRLLEQLGGEIEVYSEVGTGSRFRFSWPCETVDEGLVDIGEESMPAQRLSAVSIEGRVLVVEDHAVNQQVARRHLERLGCTVVVAANGALGVELALSEQFDLIMMDVQMPILDGLAATRQIRASEAPGKRVPIIAATASAMTDELERCREAGMDELLPKPIDRAQLQAVLARYLPVAAVGVIDRERVQSLIDEDREFAAALTTTFIESTRAILLDIEAAVQRTDRAALATLAHKLRGAAQSVGGAELASVAARLEREAAMGEPAALSALGAELHRGYVATVQSLEALGLGKRVA